MNLEHHTEQMEAARSDFARLWEDKLVRRALSLGNNLTAPELALLRDIAWHAFLAGLNIK